MGIVFGEKDSVWFVGGRGTKAGDANAGGCTKDYWGDLKNPNKFLSDVMGTNGEPVSDASAWNGSQTACTIGDNGSGYVRITKTGAFGSCQVGLIANVAFAVPNNTYNGRYEVIAVNSDYIDIDMGAQTGTCDVKVGGAFDKIQTVSDVTTATWGLDGYNVEILTNKEETFSGVGDGIDIDAGGGLLDVNSWKRIIGIDDDGVELAVGSCVTIDAANYGCDCFKIVDVDNICFRHIYAYNPDNAYTCFKFDNTATHRGYILDDCKATDGKYGVHTVNGYVRNFSVIGGVFEGVTRGIYLQAVRNALIYGADVYSPGNDVIYVGYYGAAICGCTIRSDGTARGVYAYSDNLMQIIGCTFYNVIDGIEPVSQETALVEHSNIFVVADKATGKAIKKTSGSISYSDYSCLWALDGAPSASGRWGGGGKSEHGIEEDPDFIDAANGNFRPRNPNVLRGGKPDIVDNVTQMGAVIQKYQFARRAKAANLGRLQIVR